MNQTTQEIPEVEDEKVKELLNDSRYIPFLHRTEENFLSISVKWIINFILSIVELLNVPGFIILFLLTYQNVANVKYPDYKINFITVEYLLWALGTWILLQFLFERTLKNIASTRISPIWFINFKGSIKNHFYSIEKARKYSANLDEFVRNQANEYIKQELKESRETNVELLKLLDRADILENFPNEAYESFIRMVEYLTDVYMGPDHVRHKFEIVLDKIMSEISQTTPIHPFIKSGCIMIGNGTNLEIKGQLHLPAHSLTKLIPYGKRFAGKVIISNEVVWVSNIHDDEAKSKYDFTEDPRRSFGSILGYPIKSHDNVHHAVICLHFPTNTEWMNTELEVIIKTLDVYAQMVLATCRIHKR